ncbi:MULTISPECIES: malonyl-ACP O-methyltransferase BioC [Campylobacter]|uniref:malonyl-ACP O-methyltransferase BioC n=1 Tax=Campylobacter TaxID=194 RepID=UPI001D7BD010|nr:malonyl-ACP O-methyltransferase BioC [Campylobacter sp. W0065]MBZ7968402.1 malonyl-ACP O-methyltransferase BioC [Campylobacter sp. RM9759]MBZ7972584.1 malonyl-ACP O-methyltransferase BioC [Campylobacter sp. RM9753]
MNFLKAKSSYEKAAKVQNWMGDRLCEKIPVNKFFDQVFEFGCAQGEFTRKLKKKIIFKKYILNDILDYKSQDKVEIFDMNDIAQHPLSTQKFDLIASNATLQWLNFKKILPTLANMLDTKGILLLSTFGEKNLEQITKSTGFSLKYLSLFEIKKILQEHFFEILIEEDFITLEFESPLEVFRHLKLSGVNSLGYHTLTKTFLKDYEKKFQNKLTYHPIFIYVKKV